jgi:hypothetical protein
MARRGNRADYRERVLWRGIGERRGRKHVGSATGVVLEGESLEVLARASKPPEKKIAQPVSGVARSTNKKYQNRARLSRKIRPGIARE